MAERKKDGQFVSGEGYDVYVEGRLVGWFRNSKDASEAYRTEKEKASPPKEGTMGWKESLLKAGGKLKGAGGWLKKRAPSAEATKGAALTGVAAGGAAVGAGLAAGAATYRGTRAVGGKAWRLSSQLFATINILLIASLVFHYYDAGSDFRNYTARGIVLMFFALYAWIFIYSKHEGGVGDMKALIFPLIISTIALVLPYLLLNEFVWKIIHMREIFRALLIFAPIWPIVILFGMPTTGLLKVLRVIYVLFIFIAFVPSAWYAVSADFNIQTMSVGFSKYIYDVGKKFVEGAKLSLQALKKLPGGIKKATEKQIQYAVGDYYTGQVEQGKNQPIGVILENVEPVATEFYANNPVVVWATLIAKTLDPDKKITVTASCWGEKRTETDVKKEKGDADPLTDKDEFVMETTTEEEEYITCEFPPFFFEKGYAAIFVNAEFNFRTMSYVKAYFMNLETLRTMKREGIDPFTQHKITDRAPTAVFTKGPVELGMKTSSVPIGVSLTEPADIKLGITLANAWPQGMIKNVSSIVIKIPESMEIVYCDHAFEKTACTGDECEEGKYTSVYKIKKGTEGGRMGLTSIKNIPAGGHHSVACRMRVNNMDMLMGNYPMVSRYFKVTADYVYELEKTVTVNIKEATSNETGTTTTTTTGPEPTSFSYIPTSSSITLNTGQQKEFSVTIINPGTISYGWKSEGIVGEAMPDVTSYVFSSDTAGQATVTFIAVDEQANTVEERSWNVEVVE